MSPPGRAPLAAGLRVGAAETDITPPAGVELMGYGARQGGATGVHDPVHARGLYVQGADGAFLLVSAELCLIGERQAFDLRQRLAEATGLTPAQILVACTHTHSGPESGLAAQVAGREAPPHVAGLLDGIIETGTRACSAPQPARLLRGRSSVAIGRNRRIADGPLDTELLAWRFDGDDGPIAVLFQHACHPTVLGHDNLEISADWPGVTGRLIRERTGALPVFVLGAHADIDPRTRGLMDLAIPGQSLGLGFEAIEILGREVAEAVFAALDEPEYADAAPPVGAAAERVRLTAQPGTRDEAATRRLLEERKRELADLFGWSLDAFPRLSQLQAAGSDVLARIPLDEARRRIGRARAYVRDRTASFFLDGAREADLDVQVLRLGDSVLAALPVEATTAVGLEWKERARKLGASAAPGLVSIGNGWLRYLPHADDFAHPRAEQHYEVLQSLLAEGAAARLLAVAESLLDRLPGPKP